MKLKIFIILIAVLFLFGCDSLTDNTALKPNCSGKVGELVLVINNNKWESQVGDTIKSVLAQYQKALPQDEPMFSIAQIPFEAFSSIFKTHRNIIFVKISPDEEAKITLEKNRWAKPQLIIRIHAPDDTTFISLFMRNKHKILDTLLTAERERIIKLYTQYKNIPVINAIKEKHNLSITVSGEYNLDVNKDNFIWISRETPYTSQGIFIYYYEFTDTNTFTKDFLIAKRDSITKQNIPGPTDGSYMTTEKRTPIYFEELVLNGKYACKLRGLWRTENYLMGGPFVSVTMVDEKRNRVVTADGYVYGGKQDKKIYLWQIEAILHTLKIID